MTRIATLLAALAFLIATACSSAAQPLTDYDKEIAYASKAAGEENCALKFKTSWRCKLGDGVTLSIGKGTSSKTGIPYISAGLGFEIPEGTKPKTQRGSKRWNAMV